MISAVDAMLLVRLVIAHILTDFLFQDAGWLEDKRKGRWRSRSLYLHGILAGVLAYLFAGAWDALWIPVGITATHILIDGVKTRYEDSAPAFLADQAAHLLVLVIVWMISLGPGMGDLIGQLGTLAGDPALWIISAGYLVILWPCGILIGKFTGQWRKAITVQEGAAGEESLEHAGKWIGYFERFLILTFILMQQYTAIGLLVAAKSVLRYPESKRNVAEYVLIGTLVSFTLAISVGILVQRLLSL